MITTKSAWLKIQVELDDVPVGLVFTDTRQWNPYSILKACSHNERDEVADFLHERFGFDPAYVLLCVDE